MLKRIAIALCVLAAVTVGMPAIQQVIGQNPSPAATKPTPKPTVVAVKSSSPAQSAVAGTVRIVLSEQEVSDFIKSGLQERGYQVDDLVVRLEEGRFVATTSQQVAFFRVPVTIIGTAAVEHGQLAVRLTSVTAGGANVPQNVINQVIANFRTELAANIDSLAVRPVSVILQPGRLVVEGTPK